MKLYQTLASALVVSALGLAPLAADAQDRGGGRERGGSRRESAGAPAQRNDGGRQAAPRQAPRESAPQAQAQRPSESRPSAPPPQAQSSNDSRRAAPRSQEGRQYGAPQSPRAEAQATPRQYGGQAPRAEAPRQYGSQVPRAEAPRQYGGQAVPRSYGQPSSRPYSQQVEPRRAVPRQSYGYGSPSYRGNDRYNYRQQPQRYYYARPYSGRVFVRPYSWTPYRPYYFSRPYYSFRSWFSIGFGLSIGYPVPYPWAYLGTYRPRVYGYYDNTYDYGYDNSYGSGYNVAPDVSVYGGVSFDIQPTDADVWIDDDYVGTVGMFTPYGEPLTLTPGQHKVVVQRDGFRTMEWDVMVEPGQVIPYRGAMERY